MVRVCTDWFPNENPEKSGFYMDDLLKANLDGLLKNAAPKDDRDFVILISAGGKTREGKSVLELQIMAYWVYMLYQLYKVKTPFNLKENLVFKGSELIKKGNLLGEKYSSSVLGFDEAGADLESVKVLQNTTKAVKDFLRECGQYNMLIILVIPEFFDLPRGVALNRSDILIDVYSIADSDGKFQRGYANFYSRPNKKLLYLKGKKEMNYYAYKYDFHFRFYNYYPIDEAEYRELKKQALKSREADRIIDRYKFQRDALIKICINKGISQSLLCDYLRGEGVVISQQAISKILTTNNPSIINNNMYEMKDDDDEEVE